MFPKHPEYPVILEELAMDLTEAAGKPVVISIQHQ